MSSWAKQSTYTHEAKKDIFSSLEHPSKNTLVSVSVFLPLLTRFPCPRNRCMCVHLLCVFRKYKKGRQGSRVEMAILATSTQVS